MTFVYLGVMYLGGNDLCGVTLNLYPQLAQCEYTLRITPQTSFLLYCFACSAQFQAFSTDFSDRLFSIRRYMYV